ncbi:MAG: hypothetical protein H6565_14205 [Lewinellaceae bacterium]|nr:hypothetical protein [Saprospiraceae bacterium]MCB9307745.1 hypothetical protein [Lewinellaceae bacterium]MCB9353482.1 hypothetical protein [Lewinellaceae bacterium]
MGQLTVSSFYLARNAEAPITISIQLDFAQIGTIKVRMGPQLLLSGVPPIEDVALGKNKELKGKEIRCLIDIIDIQPNTNKVGARITLKGGKHDQEFSVENELAEGDPAMFYTVKILII